MKRVARTAVAGLMLSCLGLVHCGTSAVHEAATPGDASAFAPSNDQAPSNGRKRPRMDLVFALDTTGSMGGLIEGAKAKIWEIARLAQSGNPAPEVRVGLVAFRDVGDEYVTRVLPLTADLDKVYSTLTELSANGGGDGPEHVLRALRDGIEEMPWSNDKRVAKLLYLVGDAPPHFDYQDGITQDSVLAAAAKRGIRISAIRCGENQQTLETFAAIARQTDGEVATIEQNGGVVATTTPFDAELAKLNAELAATEVRFGSAAERAEADKVVEQNLAAPSASQADRASYYGKRDAAALKGPTKKDLVSAPTALATVRDEELPEAVRKMKPEERTRFIEAQQKKRAAVLAKVRVASEQREQYLKKSAPKPSPSAFDSKVFDSIKKAGKSVDVAY